MALELIIVGGGPGGLAAGVYAARMGLSALLLERGAVGGQLLNTELIEDYPGFTSILGTDLAGRLGDHARHFGLEIREYSEVAEIGHGRGHPFVRLADGERLKARAVIMAAGGLPRKLGVPGELELAGRGVSYCAVCDGAFFKGRPLAVVGGGDAAVEEADFLTRYASRVTLIHRRSEFRAQPVLVERARSNPKLSFLLEAQVKEIVGEQKVDGALLVRDGETSQLRVDGVFIFVGFEPNSGLLSVHAEHDPQGHLCTDHRMRTSVPGVWAVGDVRSQLTRQIATAVGDGTTAAVDAAQWLRALAAGERPRWAD